jgi:hypothetical protein
MALHRDIYWLGRQWAVTGYGMQAIDQKQKSDFDIEASRLWEHGLLENLQAQPWFNPDDFSKGLAVARARYPEPPPPVAPPPATMSFPNGLEPIDGTKPAPKIERRLVVVKNFKLHVERWPAKFTALWRVRIRR